MKKLSFVSAFIAVLFLISCKSMKKESVPTFTTTPSGLQYMITKHGEGLKAATGSLVTVHYTGKFLNDSVFDSSVEKNRPITITLGKGQVIKGWDEGLTYLKEGDEATFIIPADLAYGNRQVGPIPANSTLKFEVKLISVQEIKEPVPFNCAGLDTLKLESGLQIIMVSEGKGPKPVKNNKVDVHYTGYFTDGKIFDSSVSRGTPLSFEVGVGRVIKGWDEGLLQLNKGSKARLIIPSHLAYGDRQTGPIPAGSTLIFDVELIDFK
jgi:peptidylprolyl isomerase